MQESFDGACHFKARQSNWNTIFRRFFSYKYDFFDALGRFLIDTQQKDGLIKYL
ncbi:MAG: hypothetical protein ACJA1F_003187 [Paracoccaceae bacterium]|jgi:hypothetical protein